VEKRIGLCVNCLGKGHNVSNCPSQNRCRSYHQPHHKLLHHHSSLLAESSHPSTSSTQPIATTYSSCLFSITIHRSTNFPSSQAYHIAAASHAHAPSDAKEGSQVILAIAMVLVQDSLGSYRLRRALLDSCCRFNFMTEAFAQSLSLPRDKHKIKIQSIGDSYTHIKHRTSMTIKSRLSPFELSLDLCISPTISTKHPN